MNTKTLAIISILMLSSLLGACSDDSPKQTSQTKSEAHSDDEIGVLETYLEEPALETHKNGERKIGLYSENNGQGQFQDCKTGKEYMIDMSQDGSLLHSTYISLSQTDGQKLLFEIVGKTRINKEEVETLQPQRLLGIIHKATCN